MERFLMGRALIAVLALPGLVAFAIPLLLVWLGAGDRPFGAGGFLLLVPGIGLLLWCVREFLVKGHGSLAPWDPPRRLVTSGPYRISRNPMYVAVALVIAGWAVGFGSGLLWVYLAAMLLAFHLRIVGHEEPRLAGGFREEWTRYASRVPRWLPIGHGAAPAPARWRAGTLLLTGVGLLLLLAVGGLVYEAFAEGRDAREFSPPGTLVDVGGRSLHLLCLGDGEPTVLFESSGWGTALSMAELRQQIAGRTRVCSYDRRGRGWSDPAPGAETTADLANDLGVLQDRAPLRGPFIIVGTSIGGLTAELFARQYPERVAGLVFVDAASSLSLPLLASRSGRLTATACAGSALAHLGVIRLLDPFQLTDGSVEGRRSAALTYNAQSWSGFCAMARGVQGSQEALDRAPALDPEIPLVVLSASSAGDRLRPGFERLAGEVRPALLESHEHLAQQSAHGTWRTVPGSTHLIGESQPDAVAEAVLGLVEDVRSQRPRISR